MSVKTWREEFCKIGAEEAASIDDLTAAKHALRRWAGFRKGNLAKHGLEWFDGFPLEGLPDFRVGSSRCSLCIRDYAEGSGDCKTCPLYTVRGDVACDEVNDYEDETPLCRWLDHADPEPMIEVLQGAVYWVEDKQ